jgi:hypothetical protein
MTDIGPHLLGRIPSPPDARDIRLGTFLADPAVSPLAAALAVLLKSRAAASTKAWASVATPLILGQTPPAPVPVPPVPPAPVPPTPPAPVAVTWADTDPDLDQGNYGTCVGNGWAQWGNTLPIDDHLTEADARKIYYEATVIDGQPDDPDKPGGGQQGSTVRSGAKAMQTRGRLAVYAFAASIDEAVAWVLAHGPVVMGTDWTEAMFTADANGFVVPTGSVAGGHCYLLDAYDPATQVLGFRNSWGASWGPLKGRFLMHKADAEKLFASNGEACAAAELP